jgi:hypothetical protein
MATNIEVNELKINKMSEATLSAMESAGQILPNQIFFTGDSDDTMTNVEQVEVVYDMYNSSKDWGYSSGLKSSTTITGKDFSKYKGLIVYCTRYRIGFEGYVNFEQTLPTTSYTYSGSAVTGVVDGTTPYWTLCRFNVNSGKTNFVVEGFWQNGALKTESGYVVTKIEGVY